MYPFPGRRARKYRCQFIFPDKPLTLAAYSAGLLKKAYVTPIAVGEALPDMPLFLTDADYLPVPLKTTYAAAWRGVAKRWRSVLEVP